MKTALGQLLEIAGPSLCPADRDASVGIEGDCARELRQMVSVRNGFYAFESALHVFPSSTHCDCMTLQTWNASATWRYAHEGAADGMLFFAEDIFGDQFALLDDRVVLFRSESGEVETIGTTVEDWACRVLGDYELLTGYRFAEAWQARFGPLRAGDRLAPKIPFIMGGAYDIDNFYSIDSVKSMLFKADIFRQIRHLPDGAKVRLKVDWGGTSQKRR